MKLDRRLNLVVPVEQDQGTIYVHAAPISSEVFERYFKVIARAYTSIFANNLTSVSAPRVAFLLLKDAALEMGVWEGKDGVESGLLAEIRRLANVALPRPGGGWEAMPYEDVRAQKLIDDADLAEVENLLVFFILISAMSRKKDTSGMLGIVSVLWEAQITSSNCTEFLASLPTSKPPEPTGAKAPASPIPY